MSNRYTELVRQLGGRFAYADQGLTEVSLSPEQLDRIESQIRYPLPGDYREFLRDFGGFAFYGASFPLKDDLIDTASIHSFYGAAPGSYTIADSYHEACTAPITLPVDEFTNIHLVRSIPEGVTEIPWPHELLPIATDAGANQICLAIDGPRCGGVFEWMETRNIHWVADSFDDFMHSLYLDES